MGLSHTVSEIDGDFRRKSQSFATPFVFCAHGERFPWELSIGARGWETRVMGLPGRGRSLTIFSTI